MISYILCYSYLAFNALKGSEKINNVSKLLFITIFCFFIGFRHEIGVDWKNYLSLANNYKDLPIQSAFLSLEPGYGIINWIFSSFTWNIYFVNAVCSLIFLTCLITYAKKQPYPWLTLLLSYPTLILILGMGYTRQSVALAFEFIAILALEEKKEIKGLVFILLASSFHISILAVAILFIPNLIKNLFKVKYFLIFGSISLFILTLLSLKFNEAISLYLSFYVFNQFDLKLTSNGVFFRILPSLISSLILIFNKYRFKYSYGEETRLYLRMSYLLVFLFFAIWFFPNQSTFIDRFALYLSPVTLYVFPRVVKLRLFNLTKLDYGLLFTTLYFFYTFLWLNFAIHANSWVPYKNIIFM
tara:strand:+ start:319 stop:1389 length:1071 start_codon:yes stop_codon:yes gene_type:complete